MHDEDSQTSCFCADQIRAFNCSTVKGSLGLQIAYSKRKAVAQLFQSLALPCSVALFATGLAFGDLIVLLWATVLLFVANIVYACCSIRERLLFLFLHLGMALFWFTYPIIGFFDQTRSWELSTNASTEFAFSAIFLSLLFLFFGSALYEAILASNVWVDRKEMALRPWPGRVGAREIAVNGFQENSAVKYLRYASLILFFVCLAGSFVLGYQRVAYMDSNNLRYEEFYLLEVSDYSSSVFGTLDAMLPYMLCAFLATMPKKKPATICLALYLFSTMSMLIIGSRAHTVIGVLFMGLYYVVRQVEDPQQRWIDTKEKALILIGVPLGVFFMGAMNYIRADSIVRPEGFFAQIIDALYRQGVSFSVIGKGFDVNPQVQDLGFKFFTMGDFINTITQGFIGQVFFDFPFLGSANSTELALHGNIYAHTMSFFAHPGYAGGEAWGSVYLLELFADFGYMGICIFSLLYGLVFCALSRVIGRKWFWGTVALISSMSIFHMPRGSAMEWIAFIWSTRFWLAIVLIGTLALLLAFCFKRGAAAIVHEERPEGIGRTNG